MYYPYATLKDFVVNLQLTDDSLKDENGNYEQVELIVFAASAEEMPNAKPGDVIELQSVLVQFWEPSGGGGKRAQLFGKMARPHAFGFLLYPQAPLVSQRLGAATQPYKAYNAHVLGGGQAEQRLAQLRALSVQVIASPLQDSAQTYLRKIKELDVPAQAGGRLEVVDMKVQVLAVDRRCQQGQVVMYVWDATDAKPQPADLQLPPSVWKNCELTAADPRRHIMPLHAEPPDLQVLQPLPPLGTALPVVIGSADLPLTGLPEVGQWIKLRVVGLRLVQGQMQVVFCRCSHLSLLQSHPNGFEQWYHTRLANNDTSEWPHQEHNMAATCRRTELQQRTIRQVLLKMSEGQAGPFRVQLRLAGSLRALLLAHEATRLLGLPPQDLTASRDDVMQLQQYLEFLTSVDADGAHDSISWVSYSTLRFNLTDEYHLMLQVPETGKGTSSDDPPSSTGGEQTAGKEQGAAAAAAQETAAEQEIAADNPTDETETDATPVREPAEAAGQASNTPANASAANAEPNGAATSSHPGGEDKKQAPTDATQASAAGSSLFGSTGFGGFGTLGSNSSGGGAFGSLGNSSGFAGGFGGFAAATKDGGSSGGSLFGSYTAPQPGSSLFGSSTAPAFGSSGGPGTKQGKDGDNDDVDTAADADGEGDAVFGGADVLPVVQLSEVPKQTGEEQETAVFAGDGALFEFVDGKEWKERGRGELRINLNQKTQQETSLQGIDQLPC
eukprot:gene4259-4510_t